MALGPLTPPPHGAEPPRRLDGVTILVVDDHPDSLDAMGLMLGSLGARVLVAADGTRALEILGRERPDLVLTDLRMPTMDGFELARRLRVDPRTARTRVVALTGLDDEADYLRTLEAGFDGHLTKPVEYDTLGAALWRLLPSGRAPAGRPRRARRRR